MPPTLIEHRPETPLTRCLLLIAPLLFLLPAPLIAFLILPEIRPAVPEWVMPLSLGTYLILLLLSPATIAFCLLIAIESWGEWKERGRQGSSVVLATLWLGSAWFHVSLIVCAVHWVKNLH